MSSRQTVVITHVTHIRMYTENHSCAPVQTSLLVINSHEVTYRFIHGLTTVHYVYTVLDYLYPCHYGMPSSHTLPSRSSSGRITVETT